MSDRDDFTTFYRETRNRYVDALRRGASSDARAAYCAMQVRFAEDDARFAKLFDGFQQSTSDNGEESE